MEVKDAIIAGQLANRYNQLSDECKRLDLLINNSQQLKSHLITVRDYNTNVGDVLLSPEAMLCAIDCQKSINIQAMNEVAEDLLDF